MTESARAEAIRRTWGISWLALCSALGLHVIDEAMTDFLSLWNPLVQSIGERWSWSPLPTFEFQTWLGGLIVAVVILFALSSLVFAGFRGMQPVAYFLSIVMIGNGIGHIAASIYLGRAAPGVISAPLLLITAGLLLWATRRHGSLDRAPNPL